MGEKDDDDRLITLTLTATQIREILFGLSAWRSEFNCGEKWPDVDEIERLLEAALDPKG